MTGKRPIGNLLIIAVNLPRMYLKFELPYLVIKLVYKGLGEEYSA